MRSILTSRGVIGGLFFLTVLALSPANMSAQSVTDGTTPGALTPGTPAGSYPLSGLDSVNAYNGNLHFSIPLVGVGGRGNARVSVGLFIERHWRVEHTPNPNPLDPNPIDYATYGNYLYGPYFEPGRIEIRTVGDTVSQCEDPNGSWDSAAWTQTVSRITFTAADGTEYEFRDTATDGRVAANAACGIFNNYRNRGTVFTSRDGSGLTFVADSQVVDDPWGNTGLSGGYLLFRDGTRYRFDGGHVTWIRDRNGNLITFTYGTDSGNMNTWGRLVKIKDSLNREVNFEYNVGDSAPYGLCDRISIKGVGGASRVIRISRDSLSHLLRTTQAGDSSTVKTTAQLFPSLSGSSSYGTLDPTDLFSAVWLPNGQSYKFRYNIYAELARVELPTGGAMEYDYGAGVSTDESDGGVHILGGSGPYEIYRRVLTSRVYKEGNALEATRTYSREVLDQSATFSDIARTHVDFVTTNPSSTVIAKSRHYFYGSPLSSLFSGGGAGIGACYPAASSWKTGREFKTEALSTDGSDSVLRRSENTFQQRAHVSWWSGTGYSYDLEPANDARLTESKTTLSDTSQVSTRTFSYDQYNNGTDSYDYNYGSSAAGSLVRHTQTSYVTSSSYTGNSVYLISLPSQVSVFDSGSVERARTTFEYDNYNNDSNHAGLTYRSSISGLDSSFGTSYTTRGNLTASTHYLLTNGSVTGSLTGYAQYDIAGNVVRTIDGRGNATTIDFTDCYGSPDGNATSPTAPSELSTVGQASYAFPNAVTNRAGQTAYSQVDFYTGKIVDAKDVNGIDSAAYYSDALDRPSSIVRAWGTTAQNRTAFSYDDSGRSVTTTSDLNSDNDGGLIGKSVYDGLGRTIETQQFEGSGHYIALKFEYDALGRAYKTSNPYRPWQSESAIWTQSAFDALSRNTSVTTPDNAVLTTSYYGNTVTVSDQAGKSRKSVTDALGRLTTVYEDPTGSNYQTSYTYDVLDNLMQVSQGSQTRTFVYDSLRRLTSATNPESGVIGYSYDNNGNLLTRTDARNVVTTIAYDVLDRPTSKTYTNDSGLTPAVAYFYDSQSLPSGAPSYSRGYSTGRLVAVTYGGGSAGSYSGFDAQGRVITKYRQTDSVNYLMEATYYANSSLHTEVYPSVPSYGDRRTISYANDSAGRLASLSSSATTYAAAASVSGIGYASHNALSSETYGSGLIHSVSYNNRLQTNEIKLGTSGNPTSILDLTYSYGSTNNNGNVQSIGYSGGGLSYTQTFGYDALSRLTTSQEGSSWSQTNGYDQYGNRWIDYGGGVHNLSFSTTSNRITTTGYSYDSAGNLTNDTIHGYTFDGENRIVKVDNTTAYVYDGEGKRVKKLLGENTRFIYGIIGQLVMEFDGSSGALKKEYVYGGGMQATIDAANGAQYTTTDTLGSPRVVTNSSGGVVARHDYMPFGEEIGVTIGGRTSGMGYAATDGLRQKFTGQERDNETSLDYVQFRYYSSTQGRFTSIDPLTASASVARPQSWNRYTYCANNPLAFVDPTGLAWYRDITESGTVHPVWLDEDPGKDSNYVAWDGPWTYQSSESGKWIVLSNSSSQQSEFGSQEAALASLAPPEHDWDPSCANCAALSHEMNRYTHALTQSMEIMGAYMFFFTGPTGEMGELTSLGLEGADQLVNVTHFTGAEGLAAISESGTVGREGVQAYVTLPSEIPAGANPAQIERLLEIAPGRGQFSITFQTPASNLMRPANGTVTSGQALQFQLIRPVGINPTTFVRTPLALLPP